MRIIAKVDVEIRYRRAAGPISQIIVLRAALRAHDSDGAVLEVIFDIADAEDVLAQKTAASAFAAANDELDVVESNAGEIERLDVGDKGPAGGAADAGQLDRRLLQAKAEFLRGSRRDGAEECAAVDDERKRTPVDADLRQWPGPLHRDFELEQPAHLTSRVGGGR